MSEEAEKPKTSPTIVTIKDTSKPLTLHPLTLEQAVAGLLRVPPAVKPEKVKKG